MDNCLFCNIVTGINPSTKRFEDNLVVAFNDIHPRSNIHILIVPKRHIGSVAELQEGDEKIVGHMVRVAQKLAENLGIAEDGYRLVFNTRSHGGQVVDHIHLHLLGGQKLGGMV